MRRTARAISTALALALAATALADGIVGVDYGPFRDGQSPEQGVFPTANQMRADIQAIRHVTDVVRIYSVLDGFDQMVGFAQDEGMQCIPGAFYLAGNDAFNDAQQAGLIAVANAHANVPFVCAGSEALLAGALTKAQLITRIGQVRSAVTVPVTTAEPFQTWIDNTDLGAACDLVFYNDYAYFAGADVEAAADFIATRYDEMKAAHPGKRVVISETGWPTNGDTIGAAVPSVANQLGFYTALLQRAQTNGIELLAFEMYDENWKGGAVAERNWGLATSARVAKSSLVTLRPPATIQATSATATEGGAAGVVTITLSRPPSVAVDVRYVVGGTAQSADDFPPLLGVVQIPAGQTSGQFIVDALADDLTEDAETVDIQLVPGFGYAPVSPAAATITIPASDQPQGPVTASSATVRLDFRRAARDAIVVKGKIALPTDLVLAGAEVVFDFGGVARTVTLDDKGKAAPNAGEKIRLKRPKPKRGVPSPTVSFSVSLTRGSFAGALADEDLTGGSTVRKEDREVVVGLRVGPHRRGSTLPLRWSAKAGKTGTATLRK